MKTENTKNTMLYSGLNDTDGSLIGENRHHYFLHFGKRLAYIEKNGSPPEWIFTDRRHVYVQQVSNRLSLIKSAIADAHGLIIQAEILPGEDWLNSVKLTREDYIQQKIDFFTLILHSSTDRILLLINDLLNINIDPKKLNIRSLSDKIQNDKIIIVLNNLYSETSKLAESRNLFAHRGERRQIGLFSTIMRAKHLGAAFEWDPYSIKYNDDGAFEDLKSKMLSEINSITISVDMILALLLPEYINMLKLIGGIDMPNPEEINRALAVISYFQGGPRPKFMDNGDLSNELII